MKLENGTRLAAHLFSGPAAETELGCAVLLKETWEICDGRLEPSGVPGKLREHDRSVFQLPGPALDPFEADVAVIAGTGQRRENRTQG